MNTIIAPVDFSETSSNALSFAAELSKRASSLLVIVNVLGKGEDQAIATEKLNHAIASLKKSLGSDIKCESLVVSGSLIGALKKTIAARLPSLIVMGTKGASGMKRILIGSNTVNVIAKTKVPVFVIPEKAKFENFLRKGKNRVVLATDLVALKNEDSLNLLKEIALLMIEPKVRVLNVRPKNTNLDYLTDLERSALLSAFRPEIESERVTIFSNNVVRGINFYLNKQKDTGLLAMIARDSGSLIQKHYTREMASHAHFPLLVLHDA